MSGGIGGGPAAAVFLIGGCIALVAGIAALVVLPAAKTFLPRLRLAPAMPVH